MYNDVEGEFFIRAWQIINEIGDQLSHNHQFATSLLSRAGGLKAESTEAHSGFNLRRYHIDLSKETLESELERANAQIIIENHSLTQENKQLSLLLKEYEQTMETIMSKYRSHALAAQQHELTLTRHYESLLAHESHYTGDPSLAPAVHSLALGLRALQLSLVGKDASLDPRSLRSQYPLPAQPPPPNLNLPNSTAPAPATTPEPT
ncbi:hypothetical protein EW146_g1514, partial [Bondarzewia mesenterica]